MSFDTNRLTQKSQEALVAAQNLAERNGNSQVEPEHLLLALLEQGDGVVPQVLSKMQAPVGALAQQVRAEDMERVKAAYAELGIDAELAPFFSDMARRLSAAHLVISRAGASTVTELSVVGRPALLVPYPHALDHDQAANAAALAGAGGAEVHQQSSLSPEKLAERLRTLMGNPARLSAMADAARSTGKPDAVRLLADLTEAMASGKSVSEFRKELSR